MPSARPLSAAVLLITAILLTPTFTVAADPPNIVVILADDI